MFDDYKEKVILAYQKKKEASAISINLLRPTPGKLKDECLSVFGERCLPKDEKIFRLFFGPKDKLTDYGHGISKFEIDKFRPLLNFLNGKTNVTEEKNIELLAWLIDFEPRPYQYGVNYKEEIKAEIAQEIIDNPLKTENQDKWDSPITSNDEIAGEEVEVAVADISTIGNEVIKETEAITPEIQTAFGKFEKVKRTVSGSNIKKAITSIMIIAAASSGTYFFISIPPQECMYWTGDHYKRVSCNKKIDNASVIALDTVKAAHLEKITQPDTLTHNAVGKVWYTKNRWRDRILHLRWFPSDIL
ncbi:hypothetical protein [Pedobacter sp. NJ-S-72]